MQRLFCQFVVCLLLLICIFYLTCSFLLPCRLSPEWDHLSPRYLGVMFHPSGTICAQNVRFYLEVTIIVHGEIILPVCCFPPFLQLLAFAYIYFYLTCSFLLACRFSPTWDHLCPRYLEMIFSREWDHLCLRYLGVMFHPSGTICAQNVRFYIEATIIVHGEIILPIRCFSPLPQLFAFAYICFYLTCSFFLACRFSPKWDHLCPRYFEMIFSREWDHLCPRYLGVIFHPSGSICV